MPALPFASDGRRSRRQSGGWSDIVGSNLCCDVGEVAHGFVEPLECLLGWSIPAEVRGGVGAFAISWRESVLELEVSAASILCAAPSFCAEPSFRAEAFACGAAQPRQRLAFPLRALLRALTATRLGA